MRPARTRLCRTLIPFVLALLLPWCAPAAIAEGGFSGPSLVQQSQTGVAANYSPRGNSVSAESVTIAFSEDGVNLTSTTTAEGAAGHLASTAVGWDTTTVQTSVPANVSVNSNSLSWSFDKGAASLSWGQSTTEVTVVINGKTYVVAQELAIAFARATQFGASSWAEAEGTLSLPGSGSSPVPVAAGKSGGR
jgi:hypothetical protein